MSKFDQVDERGVRFYDVPTESGIDRFYENKPDIAFKLPKFDQVDEDGRRYNETPLPAGTFRMYEDKPFQWTQVAGKSLVEQIEDHFYRNAEKNAE